MDNYTDTLRNLQVSEKLQLVEQIWDDLAAQEAPIPLPAWAVSEAVRRRDEMLADPNLGSSHDEVWERIHESRHG